MGTSVDRILGTAPRGSTTTYENLHRTSQMAAPGPSWDSHAPASAPTPSEYRFSNTHRNGLIVVNWPSGVGGAPFHMHEIYGISISWPVSPLRKPLRW